MKCLLIPILAGSLICHGQELTDLDRDLLIDKLKEIQESATGAAQGKLGSALSAFRSAVSSDVAAHELWLKCVEQVDFKDEARKASAFREWRKRHRDHRDGPGFRRAIRYQLIWLIETLEIIQKPEARLNKPDVAISAISAIFSDARILEGHDGLLKADALKSVFARAYELDSLSVENWAGGPLQISEMYENVILPPWRDKESLSMLARGWDKRIEHMGFAVKLFSEEGEKDRIPEFEKWMKHGRLDLLWEKERDFFQYGNQREAALRMLAHVEKYFTHQKASDWIGDFTALVKNEKKPADEEAPEE